MNKNDIIKLNITDLTGGGDGVGHAPDGRVVFVPNTAVGDEIFAHILKVKKKYAFAKLKEIITPAESRIQSDCPLSLRCGGCVFRHISYQKECQIKHSQVENSFKRIGGIDAEIKDIIGAESIDFYRNKAQIPVGMDRDGNVVCGYYTKSSHRIVPLTDCRLHPKIFNNVTQKFIDWANANNLSVYDEKSGKGLLRHLYIRQSSVSGDIMVLVVINGDTLPCGEQLVNSLTQLSEVKSIQVNINKEDTNVILGKKCIVLYGEDSIIDVICGVKIRISPLAFYQVNHTMAEKLYNKAKELASPKGKVVLDLYCGVGSIGLSMANEAVEIIGVEIVPQAVEDAKFNAKLNGINNAKFICADAADAVKQLEKQGLTPDVVLLDPPRKGCEASLIETVATKFRPKTIVYISCNDATLARDCALFKEYGYKTEEATPVDLFARTGHVETVALLSRQINVHKMKLNSTPFEMIKSGEKTIELRLFDEKRQQVKVGDRILFTNIANGEMLNTAVVKLHRFDSFNELYKTLPLLQCGYTIEDVDKATPSDMEQYYSVEEQKKYGVVGIELCRPKKLQTKLSQN